ALRPGLSRKGRPLRRPGSWDLRFLGPINTVRRLASLLRNCDREVGPVCGAEDAVGHAAGVVRPGPFALPDRPRALAGDVAEGTAERAQAAPARLEGDVGDGQVALAEQRLGALDPPREQV